MNKRITITLDNHLETKLRELQADKISTYNKSVSFSEVVNQVLRKGLEF